MCAVWVVCVRGSVGPDDGDADNEPNRGLEQSLVSVTRRSIAFAALLARRIHSARVHYCHVSPRGSFKLYPNNKYIKLPVVNVLFH